VEGTAKVLPRHKKVNGLQVISILYQVQFLDGSQEHVHGMEIGGSRRVFNLTSRHCFVWPTVNGEECEGFAISPFPHADQGKKPVPTENTLFLVPSEHGDEERNDFRVVHAGDRGIELSFEIES
jgi:hypothetical protein